MLLRVAVVSPQEVRVVCFPVGAEPLGEKAVFAYVQETADQIARYLGLSLKIREIRRMPGLTAFAADDL